MNINRNEDQQFLASWMNRSPARSSPRRSATYFFSFSRNPPFPYCFLGSCFAYEAPFHFFQAEKLLPFGFIAPTGCGCFDKSFSGFTGASVFFSLWIVFMEWMKVSKASSSCILAMKASHLELASCQFQYLAMISTTNLRVLSLLMESVAGLGLVASRGDMTLLSSSRSVSRESCLKMFLLGATRIQMRVRVPWRGNQCWCTPCLPRSSNKPIQLLSLQQMPRFILIALLPLILTAKLYQAVTLIAPGARYHLNDLYDAPQTKKMWGEITPVGLRQQESLGKAFRKEYIQGASFLSADFSAQEFEHYSLSLNRSLSSALANLYGLYPLGQGQKLEPAETKYYIPPYSYKNDIPEPKYALPEGQLLKVIKFDSALVQKCPNEAIQVEKNIKQQGSDYSEMVLTYTPFLKRMATAFSIDTASMNLTKLAALFDTINVDKYLGKTLPSQISQEDFKNGMHLYYWYQQFTRSFNLSKAYGSRPIRKVMENFDNRVKNIAAAGVRWSTIVLDEAHIVSLRNGLNFSSALCIEQIFRKGSSSALNCEQGSLFASSLIFELHSDNSKDFYIRIRSNGKYMNLCGEKSQSCDYSKWKSAAESAATANPEAICGKAPASQELLIAME